jgi:hypothetical protein
MEVLSINGYKHFRMKINLFRFNHTVVMGREEINIQFSAALNCNL